ncbi:hypothetical protein [Sandarakinorhabdus glacialis]|nr:hypothetical protein [Polymorphobacter glacialis]
MEMMMKTPFGHKHAGRKERGLGKLLGVVLAGAAAVAWFAQKRAAADAGGDAGGSAGGEPKAHRADGSDDSASFGAGIADEGTIPEAGATPSV